MEIKWMKIIKFQWFRRLHLLYVFGFIFNFRLSTPFVYEFLMQSKNFTKVQTTQEIFPVLFYSTAGLALPVFLFVDYLKYKPVIIITPCFGIAATCLHIWTSSLIFMQVAQGFYGGVVAAEIAYYVFIYSHGDNKNYQRLTSCIRAAPLGGKIISNLLAQLLVWQEWVDYKQLHYFDLAAFILAALVSIFLPSADQEKTKESEELPSTICDVFSAFVPNKFIVKWSIWSILTVCCYDQVLVYSQPTYDRLFGNSDTIIVPYNGALEGVYGTFALIGTIFGAFASFDWKFNGDLILSVTSLVQAFMLLFFAQIEHVLLDCMFYIIFGFIFNFVITMLSAEIAKLTNRGCFGLVFGLSSLAAAILQSGMVYLLNDRRSLTLLDQDLFMVYGFYYLGLCVLFIIVGLIYWFAKHTFPI